MLLTITYSGQNATDLGYLLYKNPYRPQVVELNHGRAYVFYPEISDERTTAALLLDIDPIDLARGKLGTKGRGLFDYVNDRPYVSSSFMSTAISKVFGTAMTGRADSRQALSDSELDLTATLIMLPCRGEQDKLNAVFTPLGYKVSYESFVTDEKFPAWGDSDYVNLTINGKVRLRDLLKHLYALIPVFDRQKHYWVGDDEVEKLLRIGEDWLPNHPEKEYITSRYLKRHSSLVNLALERLNMANVVDGELSANEPDNDEEDNDDDEDENKNKSKPEKKVSLNTQRLDGVVAELKKYGAKRVIALGCGEGNLLNLLIKDGFFTYIAGVDVSFMALERAKRKLNLHDAGDAGDAMRERVQLFHGSLMYRDARFSSYDAACVVEVIEHLDIPRLKAFERVLFEFAKPPIVVLTTPNKEHNAQYGFSHEGDMRHEDHRFEWTRAEFRDWAIKTADKFGYNVEIYGLGSIGDFGAMTQMGDYSTPTQMGNYGAPTQMGVFTLCG